jgi:hypothetical protein
MLVCQRGSAGRTPESLSAFGTVTLEYRGTEVFNRKPHSAAEATAFHLHLSSSQYMYIIYIYHSLTCVY